MWNQVLKQLHQSGIRLEKGTLQKVYEHIIKELLLERETSLAKLLLKEQSVLLSEPIVEASGRVLKGEGHLL